MKRCTESVLLFKGLPYHSLHKVNAATFWKCVPTIEFCSHRVTIWANIKTCPFKMAACHPGQHWQDYKESKILFKLLEYDCRWLTDLSRCECFTTPVTSERIQHTVIRPFLAENLWKLWFTEHSLIPTLFQLLLKGNDSSSTTGTRLGACVCWYFLKIFWKMFSVQFFDQKVVECHDWQLT